MENEWSKVNEDFDLNPLATVNILRQVYMKYELIFHQRTTCLVWEDKGK